MEYGIKTQSKINSYIMETVGGIVGIFTGEHKEATRKQYEAIIERKIEEHMRDMNILQKDEITHQNAMHLYRESVNSKLNYLQRVVPPSLLKSN